MAIISVPTDHASITAAVAAASAGDTILVEASYWTPEVFTVPISGLTFHGQTGQPDLQMVLGSSGVSVTVIGSTDFNITDSTADDDIQGGVGSNSTVLITGGSDTVDLGESMSDLDSLHINWYNSFADVTGTFNNGSGTLTTGSSAYDVSFSGAELIQITTNYGNDSITTGSDTSDDTVSTGAANDTVTVFAGNDTVDLGTDAGDADLLIVNWSATTGNVSGDLSTGSGTLASSETGFSVAVQNAEKFNITSGSGDDSFTTGSGNDTLNGGGGNDTLIAGNGANVLNGGAGNDSLTGGADADTLNGGDADGHGNDTLTGAGGSDTATIGGGSDTVDLGAGGTADNDRLIIDWSASSGNVTGGYTSYSGPAIDNEGYGSFANSQSGYGATFSGVEHLTVLTGSGNDTFTTGEGDDVISTGGGNDSITANAGNITMDGGDGLDFLSANLGAETVDIQLDLNSSLPNQDIGGDNAIANVERVTLTTGSGNDTITTFDGFATAGTTDDDALDDSLNTGAGNDAVLLFGGNDVVTMGGGAADDDLLVVDWRYTAGNVSGGYTSYAGNQSDNDSYGSFSNTETQHSVSFEGVERIYVTTGSGNDTIGTGDGNDSVELGSGNDSVNTRLGTANVIGGAGIDHWEADISASSADVSLNLNTALITEDIGGGSFVTEIERITLTTGAGNDTLTTFDGFATTGTTDDDALDDAINTGGGNDTVVLTGGNDSVTMGGGGATDDDLLVIDWADSTGNVTGGYTSYAGPQGDNDSYGDFSNTETQHSVSFHGVERFQVTTGSGNDNFGTGDGDDSVVLGEGNDSVNTRLGNAAVNGGLGTDFWQADISAETADITLDLNTALIAEDIGGGNFVAGIERIYLTTGSGNDSITTFDGTATAGTTADDELDDTITTGAGNDAVTLTGGNDVIHLGLNGTTDDDVLVINWGHLAGATTGGVTSYDTTLENRDAYGNLYSADTDNTVTFNGVERLSITTGNGNDTLTTTYGDDTIVSGSGDDSITTQIGKVSLDGGEGIDFWSGDLQAETADIVLDLNTSAIGSDIGGGNYVAGIERITLTTGSGNDTVTTFAGIATIGTTADDELDDNITTGAGNDTVVLTGGNDTVHLGLNGTADDDLLVINWGHLATATSGGVTSYNTTLADLDAYGTFYNADADNSVSFNGIERLSITTGGGNDTLTTTYGNDTIVAGGGDDTINTQTGKVELAGGAGTDFWQGDLSAETAGITFALNTASINTDIGGSNYISGIERINLTTGSGNDTLTTFDARLTVITTDDALDDTATTGSGNDQVTFFGGNDTATLGAGGTADDDVLIIDWSHLAGAVTGGYTSYSGVQADEENYGTFSNADANHTVTFTGVERVNVRTGAGNDFYATGLGDDTLDGGAGNDTLSSYEGDDVIGVVGDGNDSLVGGAGVDTAVVDYSLSTAAVANAGNLLSAGAYGTTSFTNVENFDLTLSNFDDSVSGGGGNDTLTGNNGNDLLNGAGGADSVDGGAGLDTLFGGSGSDYIFGDTENDLIYGDSIPTAYDGTGLFARPAELANFSQGAAVDLTGMFAVAAVADPEITGSGTLPTVSVGVDSSTSASQHWYSFTLGASGGTVTVDIDHGSENGVSQTFDTYLRIYDANGVQIAYNDDDSADAGSTSANSFVSFAGTAGATYFVKVSRYSDAPIATTADYELQVTVPSVGAAQGNDILAGGTGNDTLIGGGGDDSLSGGDDNDLIDADAGDDYVWGDDGDDTLIGDAGNDTLNGGIGFDIADYGASTDAVTVLLAPPGAPGVVSASQGTDEFIDIEGVYGSAHSDSIVGNSFANMLNGGNGHDTLDGGEGADTLFGGVGDDTFIVDHGGDETHDGFGEGVDTVLASIGYSVANYHGIEKVTLTGTASNWATGNELDNTLTGNSGDNLLDGGVSVDTMIGGAGDDTYVVDNTGDVVTELAGQGTDEVQSSISFSLAALPDVEHLTLTGGDPLTGTGNSGNNSITGNSGANTLDGGTGIDTLTGNGGNDVFITDGDDVIVENSSEGIDEVRTGVSYSIASLIFVENLTLTGSANVSATGNAGGNVLTGNGGNNTLDGGGATDTMSGGAGNDTYIVDNAGDVVTELAAAGTDEVRASVSFSLAGLAQVENLVLTGSAATGTGNTLNNTITGNSANNTLDGGAGADTLMGGGGNDIYIVDHTGDSIGEALNEGDDEVRSSVTYSLAALANVEHLVLTGAGNINGTGNAGDNRITGNSGGNTLDGGAGGVDTLTGGTGNDVYITDGNDVIVELTGGGIDEIRVTMNYSLVGLDFVENLTLTGNFNTTAVGNINANVLTGDASNNVLDGGAATDTMIGGAGNDTYKVDSLGDVVTELASGGTDEIQTAITYSLAALVNVEKLTLTGIGNVNATGNALNNTLTGNSGINTLDGLAGADTMAGGAGNDIYIVDNAADVVTELAAGGTDEVKASVTYSIAPYVNVEKLTLTGTANINATGSTIGNTLTGNAGNNLLDGFAGADTMNGGAGNDIFMVENVGDIPYELVNEGTDEVRSTITYSLANHIFVENLTLLGSLAINGTGNLLGNRMSGNGAANRIDGGGGADTMSGGAGNDTYLVDNIGDVVTELAGGGTDEVIASVSYSLVSSAQTEKLTLTSTRVINATGNALNNTLVGNISANTIDGGLGADTMTGLGGNDIYVVDNIGDSVIEAAAAGTDTVQSTITYSIAALVNIENVTLLGTAAINATGNGLANFLTGNSAGNTLDGGVGVDTLVGGGGNDIYIVDNIGDRVSDGVNQGVDEIRSSVSYSLVSSVNVEKLTLIGVGAINATGNLLANTLVGNAGANIIEGGAGNDTLTGGGGLDSFNFNTVPLATNVDTITDFVSGSDKIKIDDGAFIGIGAAGALGAARFVIGTAATDAADRIVYDKSTGKLYFDADGSGAGAKVQFAQVTANLTLAHTDFLVF